MKFRRSVGPVGLMFTAVSGIMGSAWLFGPYYAVQMAGPASIIAWVLGGLAMLIIAMTFAELVCMFPISGGNARFIYFSHGVLASFIFGWMMWLGYAAVAPVETMGVLQYLSSVLPWLVTQKAGITVLTLPGYAVAALVLFLLCWLNLMSVKWLTRYNAVIVWFKLLVPIIVGVTVIIVLFQPHNFSGVHGFMPYGFKGLAASLSLGGIIFAFAGYAPVIVLAGEARNPQKVIPLALIGALAICCVVYVLLEVAFIGSQSAQHLTGGWRHLHFHHDASPFLGIVQSLHIPYLGWLIFLTAVLAPIGTAMIFIATSARVAYAMSENGYMPFWLRLLNKKGVPFWAVIVNFIVGMILYFPSPGWQGMVGFLVSAFVLCYAVGPIALLALRSALPEQDRPFRLPFAKLWCYAALLFATLIVYWTGWHIYSQMMIALLLGLVLLFGVRLMHRNFASKLSLDMKHAWWAIVYLGGLGLISYLGEYGQGLKIIPMNWDIGVVAVFVLVILWWAWRSRLGHEQTQNYLKNIAAYAIPDVDEK